MNSSTFFYWIEYIGVIVGYWFVYLVIVLLIRPETLIAILGIYLLFLIGSFFVVSKVKWWARRRQAVRLLLENEMMKQEEIDGKSH